MRNKTMERINRSRTHNNILATASDWSKASPVAIATLVNIEGSAPYPIGAQMVVASDGRFAGQITGGCAERAIADHAVQAIREQSNGLHRYGLDSPYFDIQLPCGSGIDVHFEVGHEHASLNTMQSSLTNREVLKHTLEWGAERFEKIYTPQPLLVLAGQGPILLELARSLDLCGFDTHVLAQNEETLELFQSAKVEAALVHEYDVRELPSDAFTGLVSLFHEHDRELPLLMQAFERPYFYIGALGSRKTHAARLEALRALGASDLQLDRIHGPVGVAVRATTPSQIAVAIAAQAIDELNLMLARDYPQQTAAASRP